MSKLVLIIIVTFFCILQSISSFALEPTFDMSIRNITTYPDPVTGADSLLTFDIYLQWTNPHESVPFEYWAYQAYIYIDNSVFNGGVIYGRNESGSFFRSIPITSDLPPALQGVNCDCLFFDPQRDMLQTFPSDFPDATVNYIVDSTFPGTRLMRFKLRTNAHIWSFVSPNLKFKLSLPTNTAVGYFMPPLDPKHPEIQLLALLTDTINNHFTTDFNPVLPVELSSFNSITNKNIVSINWSTTRESNNAGFDIERKSAGTNEWSKIGYVPGNRTVNGIRAYTFTERLNTGKYNYRLKQKDFNGNFEYFNLLNEVEVGIPSVYSISQNYPNPFNPSTSIDFQLPFDSRVSILLYDISGRQVGNLLNETKTSGYYILKFDGSALSSGIYFYTINAQGAGNNFISTKRMMLIK
ncbi:MAG: T9SS type A sorting domain-containing protein [Ignavibacteria bacterium]